VTFLLDLNLLIALAWPSHIHHHHGKLATLDQAVAALLADTKLRAQHLEIIANLHISH
jgi:hypothetical protein